MVGSSDLLRLKPSSLLRQKIGILQRPFLDAAAKRFWARDDLQSVFSDFLFLTHCVIRASAPIMQAARDAACNREIGEPGNRGIETRDRVAEMLIPYLAHHIQEEHEHDDWLLDDMEALGMKREDILKRIPPPEVAEVVGAQYYWLHHAHPVAVLGYIAVLEGDPPREEEIEAAIVRTGLPRDAFRTFLSHAKLDPGHKEEFEQFLDSLPLAPEQEALVGVSAIHTAAGMQRIFARLG
jgi:heme oxygenase-like protein